MVGPTADTVVLQYVVILVKKSRTVNVFYILLCNLRIGLQEVYICCSVGDIFEIQHPNLHVVVVGERKYTVPHNFFWEGDRPVPPPGIDTSCCTL